MIKMVDALRRKIVAKVIMNNIQIVVRLELKPVIKGEKADSQDSKSVVDPWNPGSTMRIPGVPWESWEYYGNPGSPWESRDYKGNPGSTMEIPKILGVQNPSFPP